MRKVRIVSAMLVIILGVTGCGRISKLTDKKSEQEKVRVIQNEKPEKNEQTEAPEPEEKEKKLLVAIDPGHQAWDVDMSAKEQLVIRNEPYLLMTQARMLRFEFMPTAVKMLL